MGTWSFEPARDYELPPVERARSLKRESGLVSTAGHLAWRIGTHAFFRAYNRLSIDDHELLPQEPPFVMIANHTSHLDALVLASVLPFRLCDRVFPVAAGDVFFTTPAVSLFAATLVNALPMWRKNCGSHALAELRQRLVEEPCGLILFPEGGRSRDGLLQPFKAGLGMLLAGTSVPVIPCHIHGAFEAYPAGTRLPRPRKIQLKIGQPLVFDSVSSGRDGWNQIATVTREAIEKLAAGRRGSQRSAPAQQGGLPDTLPERNVEKDISS
jgi:1-acyl-sn-glycerol-3-phosphate acyltransferase